MKKLFMVVMAIVLVFGVTTTASADANLSWDAGKGTATVDGEKDDVYAGAQKIDMNVASDIGANGADDTNLGLSIGEEGELIATASNNGQANAIHGLTITVKDASVEARIAAGEKIEVDDWMPEEYRLALIKLISMHGMSEIMGALPEKEWVPKAPTLYRKLGIMAKVQDEMGHGQLLLRVAEDLLKPYGKNRGDLMIDLFEGRLKFHNVFHMETKSWGDAGLIGWLVDGSAIISQTNMLGASYGPYARALQRICAEEVFQAQHGEAIIMAFLV